MERLTLRKRITLPASPDRVFAALTTPEEIIAYYPFQRVESAGRQGGAIIFHGQLNGVPFTDYGEITVWEPAREFAYTYWSDNHGTPRTPEHFLTIRYRLVPTEGGGTELHVHHERVPDGPYATAMNAAWDGLLELFVRYIDRPIH